MYPIIGKAAVALATRTIDLRKGIDGLATIIEINICRIPSRRERSSCSAGNPTLPEIQYQDRSGHHMLVMGVEIKTGGHKEAYQGRNGKNRGQRTEVST